MGERKTALITGASRGIGRAIAVRLAKDGCDVAVIYAGNKEAAEETCRMIEENGAKSLAICCDVSDPQQCKDIVKQVMDTFGSIDILVNNAGITRDALVLSMKEEDFQKVIDTNLNGAFYMIKNTYHAFMKRRKGRIINISSISGVMGNAGQANYAAAKAGLIGMTKSVAKELGSRGVCCNCIAPGFIETAMTKDIKEDNPLLAQVPMRKMGTPEDVANLALFLASPESDYITGETIRVDGGLAI